MTKQSSAQPSTQYLLHIAQGIDVKLVQWSCSCLLEPTWTLVTECDHNQSNSSSSGHIPFNGPVNLKICSFSPAPQVVHLQHPGTYLLQQQSGGEVTAVELLKRPLLLMSDLDDTMIGPGMDEGSKRFSELWQASCAMLGRCQLVYNTGRTLPLYEEAVKLKGHCMPKPDALICGVGTRIYYRGDGEKGWVEDEAWTASLEEGWSYEGVRGAIDQVIENLGTDRVHYRADVELHRHKQTVLVRAESLVEAAIQIQAALSNLAIQAVLIQGGIEQDWKFIDVVPLSAGKGSALKYVRNKLGFEELETVAAGDSSNDRLMLEASKLSIIVGNCMPEIRHWARSFDKLYKVMELAEDNGDVEAAVPPAPPADSDNPPIQLLDPDRIIVIASKPAASGVLQGLRALGFV